MLHSHPEALVQQLAEKARQIRLDVLDMVYRRQAGHPGGPFRPPRTWPACTFTSLGLIRRARYGKGACDTFAQTGPDTESQMDACGLSVEDRVAAVKRALKHER